MPEHVYRYAVLNWCSVSGSPQSLTGGHGRQGHPKGAGDARFRSLRSLNNESPRFARHNCISVLRTEGFATLNDVPSWTRTLGLQIVVNLPDGGVVPSLYPPRGF